MKPPTTIIAVISASAILIAAAACSTGRSGYETAEYKLVKTDGVFEVRAYQPIAVASTSMESENSGFGRLFNYITGQNESQSKIAMTTPVFVSSDVGEKKELMSFVLPTAIADNGAPEPAGGKVFLNRLSGGDFAVYRYAGRSSESLDKDALVKLQAWVAESGLSATPESKPRYAYYDPPWTLGPLRRNEVMIEVR